MKIIKTPEEKNKEFNDWLSKKANAMLSFNKKKCQKFQREKTIQKKKRLWQR
jgi:U3 small nucleolar RNA-associated protein 14